MVGHLGPDLLGPDWDAAAAAAAAERLAREPGRPIGEALLDQRNLAGLGTIYTAETLFLSGVDPWRPVGSIEDLPRHGRPRAPAARREQGAAGARDDRRHQAGQGDLGVRAGGAAVPALRDADQER